MGNIMLSREGYLEDRNIFICQGVLKHLSNSENLFFGKKKKFTGNLQSRLGTAFLRLWMVVMDGG